MYYVIETPKEVFWSKQKIDATYKHVEFLYRDKAKWREIPDQNWKRFQKNCNKKLWEITT